MSIIIVSPPTIENVARVQAELRAGLEAGRHEREVKLVALLDSNEDRAWYIDGVRESRGDADANRLRRDVWELMKAAAQKVEPLQETLL
jgi:hypothetical protein